jgi:hypothetical protein
MGTCETCGNTYEHTFTVRARDVEHVFDSFECAIQALAPRCAHCDCRIIGHGVQHGERPPESALRAHSGLPAVLPAARGRA